MRATCFQMKKLLNHSYNAFICVRMICDSINIFAGLSRFCIDQSTDELGIRDNLLIVSETRRYR
jgi:hypothetical protein